MPTINLPRVSTTRLEFDTREVDPRRDRLPVPDFGQSRHDDEIIERLAAGLIESLVDYTRREDAYVFTFNVLALDRYNNRLFDDVLYSAYGMYRISKHQDRRFNERDTIDRVSEGIVKLVTGYYYLNSRDFRDDLNAPDRMHDDLLRAGEIYEELLEKIEDFDNISDRDSRRGSGRNDRHSDRGGRSSFRRDRSDGRDIGRNLGNNARHERSNPTHDTGEVGGLRFKRDTSPKTEESEMMTKPYTRSDHTERARESMTPSPTPNLGTFNGKAIIEFRKDDGFVTEDGTIYVPYDGKRYGLGFKRTPERTYLPAFNRNLEKAFYVFAPDKDVDVEIFKLAEVEVDREAHKTTEVAAQERARAQELKQAMENTAVVVDRNRASVNFVPKVPATRTVIIKDKRPVASLTLALADNEVQSTRTGEDGKNKSVPVLISKYELFTTLGGFSKRTLNLVDELRKCGSNIMAAGLMETFALTNHTDLALTEEYSRINALMVETTNEIIRKELGAAFSITNFAVDLRSAIEILTDEQGAVFGEALRDHPGLITRALGQDRSALLITDNVDLDTVPEIKACHDLDLEIEFTVATDEHTLPSTPDALETLEAASRTLINHGVLLIVKDINVTMVDANSRDFGIEVTDGVLGLTVRHQPGLTTVCENMDKNIVMNHSTRYSIERYLQTRDGAIYKLFYSGVNPSFSLIQRQV